MHFADAEKRQSGASLLPLVDVYSQAATNIKLMSLTRRWVRIVGSRTTKRLRQNQTVEVP